MGTEVSGLGKLLHLSPSGVVCLNFTSFANDTQEGNCQEAENFGNLLWATGFQCHAPLAKELIFVGDGAEWIWNLVEYHYPQAVQIVDWFHAAAYLTPVASLAGSTPEAIGAWGKQVRDDLLDGSHLFHEQSPADELPGISRQRIPDWLGHD
jgi:hypothetical protein